MTAPLKITEPGIYPDISSADYFADPAPQPSLTQSVAKILLDHSPLHAWHAHPRLNPDYRQDDDRKFDVGNIAHAMMLGRGKIIEALDFDDWRTKAAKEAREAAAAAGKLAVLGKHYALAGRMVTAARQQLELRELGYLFTEGGQAECCLAWQEEDTWLRQLVDWLAVRAGAGIVADYKTTDMSAAPHNLSRMMVSAGWHIQAAMSARALDALKPEIKGRYLFVFVVQECEPPYCLNVAQIGDDALVMGRKQIDMALDQWRAAMKANRWPGYPLETVIPDIPPWFEAQILDREIHEAAQGRRPKSNGFDPENLMAG